jgi:hypothetical protein
MTATRRLAACRRLRATAGPNFSTHRRMLSLVTSRPRSASSLEYSAHTWTGSANASAPAARQARRQRPLTDRSNRHGIGSVDSRDSLIRQSVNQNCLGEVVLGMMSRLVLSDAHWDQMSGLIIGRPDQKDSTGRDNRMFVEGVLWIVRTGSPLAHRRPAMDAEPEESGHDPCSASSGASMAMIAIKCPSTDDWHGQR